MAKIRYFAALGENGIAALFYDAGTLAVTGSTPTSAEMADAAGARVVFTGTGIAFNGQTPTSGTITGIDLFDSSGALLTTVRGTSLDAVALFGSYQSLGLLGVQLDVIRGNDKIYGTAIADLFLGQQGRDEIFGGRGGDNFDGGTGNDTMTGGAGPDTFFFSKGYGTDTITDFDDTGAQAGRDQISLTRAMYRDMVATQVGTDVELTFGRDTLILQGYDIADLGRSDFVLG